MEVMLDYLFKDSEEENSQKTMEGKLETKKNQRRCSSVERKWNTRYKPSMTKKYLSQAVST